MASTYGTPSGVADCLVVLAAVVWLIVVAGLLARLIDTPGLLLEDLRHPILTPFYSLVWVDLMAIAVGFQPIAAVPAKACFIVAFIATILFGGLITGQWISIPLDRAKLHPGYFLPTVAGGLLGAEGAAEFGLHNLGWFSFGIGLICWVVLGSVVINRLFLDPPLAAPLVPALTIELAPPALAGGAYFALHGPVPGPIPYGFAGYAVLMVLVQVRLLPIYIRTPFSAGFWSFTFPWCAAVVLAVHWLAIERPSGATVWAALAAAAVSLLIAAISARSVIEIARGTFLPPAAAPVQAPAVDTVAAPESEPLVAPPQTA